METLNIVVSEIILCLVVAWVLGFLAAWILFRKVQNEYEQEIEELEETLSYSSTANKMQEREIVSKNLKIQEFEKNFSLDIEDTNNKETTINNENREKDNQDEETLRRIEDNLSSLTKK